MIHLKQAVLPHYPALTFKHHYLFDCLHYSVCMHLLWQVCVYVCVIMYSMKYDAIPGTEPFSSQEASGRIVVKQAVPLLLKFAVIISCTKILLSTKRTFSLYIYFSRDGISSSVLSCTLYHTPGCPPTVSPLSRCFWCPWTFSLPFCMSLEEKSAVIFHQCCERGWELSPLTCVLICWNFIFAGDIFYICWFYWSLLRWPQNKTKLFPWDIKMLNL